MSFVTRMLMHNWYKVSTKNKGVFEICDQVQDDSSDSLLGSCFQEFEEVSVFSKAAQRSFMMFVRKDIRGLFQELYDKLEVRLQGCMQIEPRPGHIHIGSSYSIAGSH